MQDSVTNQGMLQYEVSWDRSKALLEDELDPQIFNAYIKPLKINTNSSDSSKLVITAPSRFICRHVDENFRQRIEKILTQSFGVANVSLSFAVAAEATSQEHSQNSSSPYVIVKRTSTSNIRPTAVGGTEPTKSLVNSRYTFDNFVVGSSNQFCHAAAMRVGEEPGGSYNPLFIYGGVGLGKTHLLHAIANAVLANKPAAQVLYLSSEMFTNQLIQSLRCAKMDQFKNRLREADLLLIDDIQFMQGKERTQEEFFHTFNALYHAKNQIVITSDRMPQDIPDIEERLRTRFSWGLIADLQAPDFETRVAILKRKASQEQFDLPESVAHLIAEHISSNVRELEGALTRLHAVSSIQSIPITLDLAQSALKQLLQPKRINISISDIKGAVAEHFKLKIADLASKRRTRNLSFPRHIAMYLCRKHTTASFPEIGTQFGGRDHSSVIHAANVITEKLRTCGDTQREILKIERALIGH